MKKLSFARSRPSDKQGLPPGTLAYIGAPKDHKVNISIFRYNKEACNEIPHAQRDECLPQEESPYICWINIDGIHDLNLIADIGKEYHLHPLILEDIVNTTQRPKVEEYDNGIYMVLKMISFDKESREIDTEQISLFLGKNYVLTFQEKPADVLGPIRNRLQNNLGRIRKNGPDYLFYALIEIIISNYFRVLEGLEDKIDELEDELNEDLSSNIIQRIQKLKRELIFMRKSVYPLREMLGLLERNPSIFIIKKTQLFLRDLQGQTYNISEMVETYRDILSNLHDLHLSLNGHKMNEVMKLLTIISTIFIPLTFIAGIYGMNFENMPELKWPWGYGLVWLSMIIITMILVVYFKIKKWF